LDDALSKLEDTKNEITGIPVGSDPVLSPSFFQPFTPAQCSVLSWSFSPPGVAAQVVSYDLCPYVEKIRNVAGYGLYLLTAGLLFSMYTRRPSGV